MAQSDQAVSVLLVTASEKTAQAVENLLPPGQGKLRVVPSASRARQVMLEDPADIAILSPPLPDESGLTLAEDMARFETTGVLLLLPAQQYDGSLWQLSQAGILLLEKPVNRQLFQQAFGLLLSTAARLRQMETRTQTLQEKIGEIRLVNRAKLLLVERLRMTEADAHRFIEKSAMDRGEKRRTVAESIIRSYENRPAGSPDTRT